MKPRRRRGRLGSRRTVRDGVGAYMAEEDGGLSHEGTAHFGEFSVSTKAQAGSAVCGWFLAIRAFGGFLGGKVGP